jgi:hypothetical protein
MLRIHEAIVAETTTATIARSEYTGQSLPQSAAATIAWCIHDMKQKFYFHQHLRLRARKTNARSNWRLLI